MKLKPEDAAILSNTAYLTTEAGGNLDEALAEAQKAVRLDANQPHYADTLGWALPQEGVGLDDSAVQVFRGLTERYPENPTFHYHFGMALLKHGDRSTANQEFKTALRGNSSGLRVASRQRSADRVENEHTKFVLAVFVRWIASRYPRLSRVSAPAPAPLLSAGHPVDWWFTFKLNSAHLRDAALPLQEPAFGGTPQTCCSSDSSSRLRAVRMGRCSRAAVGARETPRRDPIGATFDQVYNGTFNYVIWNDQLYDDLTIKGLHEGMRRAVGALKGMVAWNSTGDGFVMQASTPRGRLPEASNRSGKRMEIRLAACWTTTWNSASTSSR